MRTASSATCRVDDLDAQMPAVILVGQEPGGIRVLAVVRPEGELIAGVAVEHDDAVADLDEGRPAVADDRPEERAGQLPGRHSLRGSLLQHPGTRGIHPGLDRLALGAASPSDCVASSRKRSTAQREPRCESSALPAPSEQAATTAAPTTPPSQ